MSLEEAATIAHCRGLVATNLSLKAQVKILRMALHGNGPSTAVYETLNRERKERLVAEELARSRMEELCKMREAQE